jgi:hypothetical protein
MMNINMATKFRRSCCGSATQREKVYSGGGTRKVFLLAVTIAGGPNHGGPKTTAADDRRGYVFPMLAGIIVYAGGAHL